MRFLAVLVNVQYYPGCWDAKLVFELFSNDYSTVEEEDQEGIPYFNRWHAHMIQVCAMSLSYLQKCAFTGGLFSSEFGNLSALFERVQRPISRNTLLKYVFEPLASKGHFNWSEFLILLTRFQIQDQSSVSYEASVNGYLNQVGSFLAALFITPGALHQKVESTIDLEKGSIIESPSGLNSEFLLGNVDLLKYLLGLLEWRLSALSTKIATVVFHHFTVLLQRGHPAMKELLLVNLPRTLLHLLDQEDLQGLYIALISEAFKWLLYYNQTPLILSILQHPTISEMNVQELLTKLRSSSSCKSQRTEVRKCLAPYLVSKGTSGGGRVVKKLPEKLVIMQKLLKQKEESCVDVSVLFYL